VKIASNGVPNHLRSHQPLLRNDLMDKAEHDHTPQIQRLGQEAKLVRKV
jgi:hypothetical protein